MCGCVWGGQCQPVFLLDWTSVCVCVCVCACVRACVRVCVCVCVSEFGTFFFMDISSNVVACLLLIKTIY